MFEVVSSYAEGGQVIKASHGVCRSYLGAANLATIARRAFPTRIVLVIIPKYLRDR